MPQKKILLEVSRVLVQYLELSLILEVFNEHINLLLDLEHLPLLLSLLVQLASLKDGLLEEELLLLQVDVAVVSFVADQF
jgi:hypothetical protein